MIEKLISISGSVLKNEQLYYWTENNACFYKTDFKSGHTILLDCYNLPDKKSDFIMYRPGVSVGDKIIFAPASCGHILVYDDSDDTLTYYNLGFTGEYCSIVPYKEWLYFFGIYRNIIRFNPANIQAQRIMSFSKYVAQSFSLGLCQVEGKVYTVHENGYSIRIFDLEKELVEEREIIDERTGICTMDYLNDCFWLSRQDGSILCMDNNMNVCNAYNVFSMIPQYDEYAGMEMFFTSHIKGDNIYIGSRRINQLIVINTKEKTIKIIGLKAGDRCGSFFDVDEERVGLVVEEAKYSEFYKAAYNIIIDTRGEIIVKDIIGLESGSMFVPRMIENPVSGLSDYIYYVMNNSKLSNCLRDKKIVNLMVEEK